MKKSKIYVDSMSYSILVVLGSIVAGAILGIIALWTEVVNAGISKTIFTIILCVIAISAGAMFVGYILYLKDISQEK